MKFRYREVRYAECIRVPDQATAIQQLASGKIALVMPGNLPKSLKLYCPCGCGEILTVNLMRGAAKAWQVGFEPQRGFSLWPSVWRDSGCKCHFILRSNTAWVLYGEVPENEDPTYWDRIMSENDRGES